MSTRQTKLGEVLTINPRFEKPTGFHDATKVRFVPMAAVDEMHGQIVDIDYRPFSEVSKGFTNFKNGDVLFAKITPCMQNGKAAIFTDTEIGVGFGSTEFFVLRPGPDVISGYIYHLIRQESFRAEARANFTGTAGQQRVPRQFLENYQINLPSLSEQQRIVDILDRAATIQRLRKAADDNLKEIIPALFVDMFGDPASNSKGWRTATVGDVITSADYGSSSKASDEVAGLPMLRMGNVSADGQLLLENLKYVQFDEQERGKYLLRAGDILFNRTNSKELVGKTGIWDGRMDAVFASYFIRLRTNEAIMLPEVLWAFMNSKAIKRQLFGMARGAIGQSNINSKELKGIEIYLPPLRLQERFAGIYHELVANRHLADNARNKLEAASSSIVQTMFSV